MRNLERLIKKLEAKTSRMFEAEKPFCTHLKPLVIYPDGAKEGDPGNCKICNLPRLIISISYADCERHKKERLQEAKHFLAEIEYGDEFANLERERMIEIVCDEFVVSREELLSGDFSHQIAEH